MEDLIIELSTKMILFLIGLKLSRTMVIIMLKEKFGTHQILTIKFVMSLEKILTAQTHGWDFLFQIIFIIWERALSVIMLMLNMLKCSKTR